MAVKLGSVAPIGFEAFASKDWLGFFRQLGCSTVQAYRNAQANVTVEQMRDYIAAGEMPCDSIHGIFGEDYDPSNPDEAKRISAVDTFKKEGDLALALGGPLVVVHGATIRRDGITASERELRISQLKKSISDLGNFGLSMGVHYAFENLPNYHAICADLSDMTDILAQEKSTSTSICFDTGHANMVGDAPALLIQGGSFIEYIHFSDNSGQADEHLMPTHGTLDIDAIARAIHQTNYSGTVMLETFPPLDQLHKFADSNLALRFQQFLNIANGTDAE